MALEADAATAHVYQLAFVPGLLQTAEYARAVYREPSSAASGPASSADPGLGSALHRVRAELCERLVDLVEVEARRVVVNRYPLAVHLVLR
ncbi:MAG: Scr1 family TA system antitoxin-like transcriptional regulator, partial [Pseudonocardiaceae bacterium]